MAMTFSFNINTEKDEFYIEKTADILKISLGWVSLIWWKNLNVDETLIYSCNEIIRLRERIKTLENNHE